MSGPWGSEGSLDDAGFVTKFRERVDDHPQMADEKFDPDGSKTKFKCNRLKVNDDDYLQVVENGTIVPLANSIRDVKAGNCYVNADTGLITFGTAPAAGQGTVICYHNQVQWRDSAILDAMYDGLRTMFPTIWRNAVTTAITLQVLQWDYTLPADFQDPRVKIRRVSVQEVPASTNPFRALSGQYRVYGNPPMLRILGSQAFTPGSVLQIEYTAPYRTLADLDGQAQDLPVWYAAGTLLGFKEGNRARTDSQTVMADQNAVPPGYRQNSGAWFMTQFRTLLAALQRPVGMPPATSTYAR